jgi:hypothetical protein
VVGSLKSLAADNYVVMEAEDHESWKLSEEGVLAADQGSPEARVFSMVRLPASSPPRCMLSVFVVVVVCPHVCCLVTQHAAAKHSTLFCTTFLYIPTTPSHVLWASP